MRALIALAVLVFISYGHAEEKYEVEKLKPLLNAAEVKSEKLLFVYFWASWCPDCREKLTGGGLLDLQKEFPQAKVVTINADREESRGKNFSEAEKISLPVYRDEAHVLAKSLKLFAVPAWAILEKNVNGQWSLRKSSTGSELGEVRAELKRSL